MWLFVVVQEARRLRTVLDEQGPARGPAWGLRPPLMVVGARRAGRGAAPSAAPRLRSFSFFDLFLWIARLGWGGGCVCRRAELKRETEMREGMREGVRELGCGMRHHLRHWRWLQDLS